jgi:hypothetical protein
MNGELRDASPCARVFELLVDEGDVGADRVLAEHLGSCVTCFRTLTELRDAPRVAEALRDAASATRPPAPSDRFWEDLAARTTQAAAATLYGSRPVGPEPIDGRGGRGRWRWSVPARARVAVFATALAAAAVFALVARRPPATLSTGEPAVRAASGVVASVARSVADDETGDEAADVANLDGTALRRLLDRLSTRAPAVLTSIGASDANEASDLLGDDDRRVNDEVADLDGTALRRVASSLGGSSW